MLGLPTCATGAWSKIDAACALYEFDRQLVTAALHRRLQTWQERQEVRARLGRRWSTMANNGYGLLKITLHGAVNDPEFIQLVREGSPSLFGLAQMLPAAL